MAVFPIATKRVASADAELNLRQRRILIVNLKILIMQSIKPLNLADRTRVLLALQSGISDELEAYEGEVEQ